jgi:hypothetical protein
VTVFLETSLLGGNGLLFASGGTNFISYLLSRLFSKLRDWSPFEMLLSFNFDLITKCLNLSFDCFLDVEAEVSSGGKFLEAINNFLSYLLMDLCFFIDF